MFSQDQIHSYLKNTLELAEKALQEGNYPIGSIIVNQNKEIVAKTYNQCTTKKDITAHAEIIALQQAGEKIDKHAAGKHYLFTSLEPCFGCSFFIARTNITHIYASLKDPHKGGISGLKSQSQFKSFFKNINIVNEPSPDTAQQSKSLMRQYFKSIGNNKAATFYT